MDAAQLSAITDANVLRGVVAEKLIQLAERDAQLTANAAKIAAHERAIVYKDAKIEALTLEIARLQRVQFAARSEKMDPEQRTLFDEAMAADLAAVESELEALKADTAQAPAVKAPRSVPKRRPLPPELARVEVRHEPESCTCGQCGSDLVQIGEHVSEKLDCKPLEFFVRRDVHPQYACRACETVVAAPVARSIIERGIAAPGLLAQVLIGKYVDHLPLYRQEAIFARSGVEIGRNTMAEWIGACGVALQPLVAAMRSEMLEQSVLHADETPVAQLDPGAGQTKRAYLFAYRTGTGPPIVVFDYCGNRSGKHASRFLDQWRGALMVDDYAGYKHLFAAGITELGCWAHARRKFFDLHKASSSPIAQEGRSGCCCAPCTSPTTRRADPGRVEGLARSDPSDRGWQQRYFQSDRLHLAPLAGADPLSRRRPLPDRQQPDRERDPPDRAGPQELVVRRIGNRRDPCRGDHELACHRQGQRPRPACMDERCPHAFANDARPRHPDAAAVWLETSRLIRPGNENNVRPPDAYRCPAPARHTSA
jgi:transposase